jgi:hypothetical protein
MKSHKIHLESVCAAVIITGILGILNCDSNVSSTFSHMGIVCDKGLRYTDLT